MSNTYCDWCLKQLTTTFTVGCFKDHGVTRSFLCNPCAEFMASDQILVIYPDEETIYDMVLKNIKINIERARINKDENEN